MIPEHLKQNTSLEIEVFGLRVQVSYTFYWPEKKSSDQPDPLVSHIEYRAESGIISKTGYHSHFFQTALLKDCEYQNIQELVTAIGEHLALEEGYQRPVTNTQLRLF